MLTSFLVRAEINDFIAELQRSLQYSTFVKLSLGNYKGPEEHLQKVSVRQIETKKGSRLAFQSKYTTRDAVKNFDLEEGVVTVGTYLENGFRFGHLFTTASDFQLTIGKKNARLVEGKPTFETAPATTHDREKKHLIDPSAFYLKALGITKEVQKPARKQGRNIQHVDSVIHSDQRDKWRQINKFVEIVDGLIANSQLKDKKDLRIIDMGSGKGYLTFALYDHLRQNHLHERSGSSDNDRTATLMGRADSPISVTGVDQRPELVALGNDIACASGFEGLKFVHGTIADLDLGDIDILIALHACDTATDDALYKGITANASIIVAAPCCHHELKKQLNPPELLAGILKHPVMLERTAETITDGIRSLLLEAHGYKTKMFEFVATEHTTKNNILVATKRPETKNDRSKLNETEKIMEEFGIEHQRLAELIRF